MRAGREKERMMEEIGQRAEKREESALRKKAKSTKLRAKGT
jgi:hypothetical protein